jgi:hypothetical protein
LATHTGLQLHAWQPLTTGAALQEHHRLQEASEQLQKKVRTALEMRSKGRQAAVRDMSKLDGAHARYQSALSSWGQMVEEKERLEAGYQAQLFEMKAMLAERIQRADDISRAYHHFKMEVAKSAEHSKTGKPISQKLLAQLLQEERIREEEVRAWRPLCWVAGACSGTQGPPISQRAAHVAGGVLEL